MMQRIMRRARSRAALPLLAVGMGASACSNPVDVEPHPIGLVVYNEQGAEVARYRLGSSVTGQLSVPVGASAVFRVDAIGEDDEEIEIDGTDLSLTASVESGPATVAVQSVNQIMVTGGAQAGMGALRVRLHHGGHEEFNTALPFQVGS